VFPSYYEPWGYTPMECIVRGIPAITSDLSGFGDYLSKNFPDHDSNGMFISRRRGIPFQATVGQVTEWMYGLTRMARPRDRIGCGTRSRGTPRISTEQPGRYYVAAHRNGAAAALAGAGPGPVRSGIRLRDPRHAGAAGGASGRKRTRTRGKGKTAGK